MTEIPKIIHLCWFGRGEFPELTKNCIDSWKKYLPDYEIRIWNEDSFDVNSVPYTEIAYQQRQWAFVSDYVRLIALYEYGGVYMDTDVEVLKDFTDLLENRRLVSSVFEGGLFNAGFVACVPHHPFIADLMDFYLKRGVEEDGKTLRLVMNPVIFTYYLEKNYQYSTKCREFHCDDITLYPMPYFSPYRKNRFGKDPYSKKKYLMKRTTRAIHHDMGSWSKETPFAKLVKGSVRLILPSRTYLYIKRCRNDRLIRSLHDSE